MCNIATAKFGFAFCVATFAIEGVAFDPGGQLGADF